MRKTSTYSVTKLSKIEYYVVYINFQCYLYKLYSDNKLIYNNFISFFTLVLYQVYQSLRKNYLVDLSQCLLQVKASVEDMKSMYNVFKTLLTSVINYMVETENALCGENITHAHVTGEIAMPFMKSVLLMPSPLIKINTNYADEKNDLHKLLQCTPEGKSYYGLYDLRNVCSYYVSSFVIIFNMLFVYCSSV